MIYITVILQLQTHYAGEEDPSFLLEDEDLDEGEEDDDGEVTGWVTELSSFLENALLNAEHFKATKNS